MSLVSSVTDIASAAGMQAAQASQISQASQTQKASESFQEAFLNASAGNAGSRTVAMDEIFEEASSRYGVSVTLLKAVAKAESNFNPNAVSKAGAVGVMQLMPATAKSLGVSNSYDPWQNIMGGAKYLRENLDRFGGDVNLALAAYNAGPNSVQKYNGIPPYKETQNYVKIVNSYMSGSPIYSGKTVQTSGQWGQGYGASALAGLTSEQLLSLYGISSGSVGSMAGGLQSSYGQSYGLGGLGALGMLLGSAQAGEGGNTVTLDQSSFASLVEMLRIQMMMNASRSAGAINI